MHKIFVILILIFFEGCIVIHNKFDAYKSPIIQGKSLSLAEGFYHVNLLHVDYKYPIPFLFLYGNGMVYVESNVGRYNIATEQTILSWSNVDKALKHYNKYFVDDKDRWGCYMIVNDTIYIQSYMPGDQSSHKRVMTELKGIIKDDHTIEIFYQYCNLCSFPPEIYTPPVKYTYYSTPLKPDTSNAWFIKKKWYKSELNYTRQLK